MKLFDNRVTRALADRKATERHELVTRESLDEVAKRSPEAAAIVERIRGLAWYHTLDLGHGVLTPGFVDHRPQLKHYGLPESMKGMRVLDCATFDGFWAYEFERRGADEVVAVDVAERVQLDVPRWLLRHPEEFGLVGGVGDSFKVAHDIIGSKVQRKEIELYHLNPEVLGTFDLVFISDVLVHLRDPQLVLERAYSVCRGEVIVADVYNPALEALGNVPAAQFLGPSEQWWYQNVACLRQMMTVAGFDQIREIDRFVLDAVGDNEINKVVLRGKAAETPPWAQRMRDARGKGRAEILKS